MTGETLSYLREKIDDAERILREKQQLDDFIKRLSESDWAPIVMLINNSGKDIRLRFSGDRKKLVEILERRREELLKKYEDL